MKRRDFLKRLCLGAAFMTSGGKISFGADRKERKPNIILILADDLGYGDIGCFGSAIHKTPNLDSMARGGMKFTDFHSNGAMCSPTRAALLTGRYQQRAGIQKVLGSSDKSHGMALEEVTFAEVLQSAGYRTGIFGKWHLGYTLKFSPIQQGFDNFGGFLGGGQDYHSHVDRSGDYDWWWNDKIKRVKGYSTDLMSDYAVGFIEENKDKPFCLYLPYQAVHFPYQGRNDKADRTEGKKWARLKFGSRKDQRGGYKEMVEAMDEGIGRILATVKKLGLEKDTLVFFTSDNGGHQKVASCEPLRGWKGQMWEGGHRVPTLAYWPGRIGAGTVTDETTLTMDLFATMAALAGAELPEGLKLDGIDIMPVLKGGKLAQRDVFWGTSTTSVIRRGDWKLIVRNKKHFSSGIELFNLAQDLGEKNNLAEAKPEMVKTMQVSLEVWQKEVTDGVKWVRR
ncbi:MAG: sulfatase [Planctomycetota bacterium]|jgi:arylsulfatase A-like enzyme